MNNWEHSPVIAEVNRIGKGRIVFVGLWTSVCVAGPALSALDQGFERDWARNETYAMTTSVAAALGGAYGSA